MLEEHKSPACNLGKKVLQGVEVAGTVAAVGSAGVLVAAGAVTVAPALITGAVLSGVATGLYSVGRSIAALVDRSKHKQSIGLDNSESRWCWLNVTTGALGATAAGAGSALSQAASRGVNIGRSAQVAFNALTVTNMVGSGFGIGCSVYSLSSKIANGERITVLEVFQLSTSVLFFTQSVSKFQTAQKIISESQATTLHSYEESLRSNRHRKLFRKAQLESRRLNGEVAGNAEVIKGFQRIKDPDNFFAGLARINKDVNKAGAGFTITAEGTVQINSAHIVDPMEFSSIGSQARRTVLQNLPQRQPTVSTSMPKVEFDAKFSHIEIIVRGANSLSQFLSTTGDFSSIVLLTGDLNKEVVTCVVKILDKLLVEVNSLLADVQKQYPFAKPPIIVLQFLLNHVRTQTAEVPEVVRSFFNDLNEVLQDSVNRVANLFREWFAERRREVLTEIAGEWTRTPVSAVQCRVCQNYYFERTLFNN